MQKHCVQWLSSWFGIDNMSPCDVKEQWSSYQKCDQTHHDPTMRKCVGPMCWTPSSSDQKAGLREATVASVLVDVIGTAQTAGTIGKAEIEKTYKISRRIEAEERGLDSAMMVFTSTQQEVDEQWGLYEGWVIPLRSHLSEHPPVCTIATLYVSCNLIHDAEYLSAAQKENLSTSVPLIAAQWTIIL